LEKIPVKVAIISAFYREGNFNWVKTAQGKAYLHDLTLDETEQQLDPKQFYRVNRQVIVSHESCKSYQLLDYGKLELITAPALPSPIIISQRRAADFKRWMDR
jgi:DNA-binding LytR/AlgR family response regulator